MQFDSQLSVKISQICKLAITAPFWDFEAFFVPSNPFPYQRIMGKYSGIISWNLSISNPVYVISVIYGTGIFHAWYRQIPCMVQVYSMHGTGKFHAWYRRIPCIVHAYPMHCTGVFHAWYRHIPCMVQAYVYRAWYRYSHACTMYSTDIFPAYTHSSKHTV